MLRILTACVLLCAFIVHAEARPRQAAIAQPVCIPTTDPMRPCAEPSANFLKGIRSIKVTMHRERRAALGGRPAGCPHAWCGCWLAAHFGLSDRTLWKASRWAVVGAPAPGPQPGAIVVWRHHVGLIRAAEGNRILVLSGNDGRAVRERWRTTSGVIAYRVRG